MDLNEIDPNGQERKSIYNYLTKDNKRFESVLCDEQVNAIAEIINENNKEPNAI